MNNIIPKERSTYNAKASVDGDEKIVISKDEYITPSQIAGMVVVPAKVSDLTNDSNFQTQSQVSSAVSAEQTRAMAAEASKYVKPSSGIPASDLASAVQQALQAGTSAVRTVNYITPDENGNVNVTGGGGGGGVSTYAELPDKPKINGVEVVGNKTSAQLGLQSSISDLDEIRSGAGMGASAVQSVNGNLPDASGNVSISTGVSAYSQLSGKPSINSVELNGNKSLADLNIQAAISDLSSIRNGAGKGATSVQKVNGQTPDSNGNVEITGIEITWSALKTLKTQGKLIPGAQYRITDYTTTTVQANTRSAGHQFDIIVTADNEKELNENARACLHNNDSYFLPHAINSWKLKYRIDNDTDIFLWADAANGKGVIYEMIDEWGNTAPYDFKNIQFKRFKIETVGDESMDRLVGKYMGLSSADLAAAVDPDNYLELDPDTYSDYIPSYTVDDDEFKWFYTFSNWQTSDYEDILIRDLSLLGQWQCYNNYIGPNRQSHSPQKFFLNNTTFVTGAEPQSWLEEGETWFVPEVSNVNLGNNSYNNSLFGYYSTVNCVGGKFRMNTAFMEFRDNDIASHFSMNVCNGASFVFNEFFGEFACNYASSRFELNAVSTACEGNNFKAKVSKNSMVSEFFFNTIGGQFMENEVSHYDYNSNASDVALNHLVNIERCTFGGQTSDNDLEHLHDSTTSGIFSQNIAKGQIKFCTFASNVVACRFNSICEYLTVSGTGYFAFVEIGQVRGTSSTSVALNNSNFFLSSMTGVKRYVRISGDDNGKIVATWEDVDSSGYRTTKGVYKATASASSWTTISPQIKTINNSYPDENGNVTVSGGGGGGGVETYAELPDKPKINNVTLSGSNTLSSLGIQAEISDLSTIRSNASAGASAYQKPSGGIPKTDLASAVQTSLGLADSAIQNPTGGSTGQVLTKTSSGVAWQDSQGGGDKVYIATFGITTYDDIQTAIQAGKAIFAKMIIDGYDEYYQLADYVYSDGDIVFIAVDGLSNGSKINKITCSSPDSWSNNTLQLATSAELTELEQNQGDITDLETTATDLVGAINEVYGMVSSLVDGNEIAY